MGASKNHQTTATEHQNMNISETQGRFPELTPVHRVQPSPVLGAGDTNAFDTTFGMPAGIKLDQFDGLDWATWSGILEAILTLHEAEDLLRFTDVPGNITEEQWGSLQRRTKAYLHLYVKLDVYSLIALNTDLPTF